MPLPGQPLFEDAISVTSTLGQATAPPFWINVTPRLIHESGSAQGKQYEIDATQTGEYRPQLDNRDAAWSPVNTSSPYAPNVNVFRPWRSRAQYPATQNILTPGQATGGSTVAAGQSADSGVPVWYSYNYLWNIVSEGDAFTGLHVFQQVVSAAQAAPYSSADVNGWAMLPGAWHSAQCQMRATAGGTSPQVRLALLWRGLNGFALSTTLGPTVTLTANSRVWQQLTVSGQAPAGAVGCTLQIQMVNSVAVTWESSGFQVEYAQTPTAWTQPGTWYPMFSGGAERYPQVYDMQGTYGQVAPVVDDLFAILSQTRPQPPFFNDVLATSPAFFFPLDDPSAATSCRDVTGTYNPAPVTVSQQGAGSLKLGQGLQSNTPTGAVLGAPGPVAAFANVDSTTTPSYSPGTWIALDKVGITGPPAGSAWTRMIAFNCAAVPTNTLDSALWVANPTSFYSPGSTFAPKVGVWMAGGTTPTGCIYFLCMSGDANAIEVFPGITMCDGNWHLVFFSLDSTGKNFSYSLDGGNWVTTTAATSQMPGSVSADTIGERTIPGSNSTSEGMQGSLAFATQWNYQLTNAQIATLYQSWRTGWSGDSTGTRYRRILGWAGYQGPTAIRPGATQDMGPATDVDGQTDALTLLQNVVVTENGQHYVRQDGTPVFEQRSDRYNQLTPVYTFGGQPGEWPYEDIGFDYDTTRVVGTAKITQFSTGQVFYANAPSTAASNYRPTLERTINVTNPQECVDAANYTANRYATPQLRLNKLVLHPAAVPALWPVALSLEISTRIRVNHRVPGQPTITVDVFVEKREWERDYGTGDATLALQASPADLNQYWVFSALHTTSAALMNSGTNTIQLYPLPDGAVNPFSCSVCSGLALTLEPGTANAETLAVQSVTGGVPMAPNGVFANGTTGWAGSHSATVTATTATVSATNVPTTVANVVSTQSSTPTGLQESAMATGFIAGTTYLFLCWVYASQATTFTTNIDWDNSTGTYLSTTTQTVANVPAGVWTLLVTTHTAPATATQGVAYVLGGVLPVGASFQITGIYVGLPATVTFSASSVFSHAANAVVCEALPGGITDPTTWDAASLLGETTTLTY